MAREGANKGGGVTTTAIKGSETTRSSGTKASSSSGSKGERCGTNSKASSGDLLTNGENRTEVGSGSGISSFGERVGGNNRVITGAVSRQLRELREVEIRKIAESISLSVPTADMEVKLYLRQFGHPVCLFGEGPFERRERLRLLVARVCAGGSWEEGSISGSGTAGLGWIGADTSVMLSGGTNSAGGIGGIGIGAHGGVNIGAGGIGVGGLTNVCASGGLGIGGIMGLGTGLLGIGSGEGGRDGAAEAEGGGYGSELFYVRGGPALRAARIKIAEDSLKRAWQRTRRRRALTMSFSAMCLAADRAAYVAHMQQHFALAQAQVGDDRPISCGRFAPDGQMFASAGWTGLVKLWPLPPFSSSHPIILRGHVGRINTLSWRPIPAHFIDKTSTFRHIDDTKTEFDVQQRNGYDEEEKINKSSTSEFKMSYRLNNQLPVANYMKAETHETVHNLMYEEQCHVVHLASAGADWQILLWSCALSEPESDLEQSQQSIRPFAVLGGHEERVNCIEFHPYGSHLGSCSHDETLRFWDIDTQQELFLQEGHAHPIYALKFHPDGSLVFAGDLGGVLRVTDLRTGRSIRAFAAHHKQILSLDIDPFRPHIFATASDDHSIKIWDIRRCGDNTHTVRLSGSHKKADKGSSSQGCIETILAHNKLISDCKFEPVKGRYILSASYDCSMKLWNTEDYTCACVFHAHDSRIMSIDISQCGNMISSLSYDRTWNLWMNQVPFESEIHDCYFTS